MGDDEERLLERYQPTIPALLAATAFLGSIGPAICSRILFPLGTPS